MDYEQAFKLVNEEADRIRSSREAFNVWCEHNPHAEAYGQTRVDLESRVFATMVLMRYANSQ